MSHSHSPSTKSHAPAHDPHEIAHHKKIYWTIFVALLIGTVVTVGLNYLHFDSKALTIAIALFVATVKAFLVAGYFMHLMSEKKTIYALLLSTAFFFVAMMYLIVWARGQHPRGSEYIDHPLDAAVKTSTSH
jgi:cytochrome c oxidase subunit 4